jgi:type IX secretion system PorP/SprF family membrane protein
MKLTVPSLLLFLSFQSSSQVTEFTGIYWTNLTHVNPAMSGLEFKHHATASYHEKIRSSFATTSFIDCNTRIYNYHGIGVSYNNNEESLSQSHLVNFNYNYQWSLKNGCQLSTGIAVGIQHASIHPIFEDLFHLYDSLHSPITPNVNIGFAYRSRYWLIGLSFASLQRSIEKGENAFNIVPSRNVNLHVSYNLPITRRVSLRSRLLAQSDFRTLSMNIGATLDYKNIVSFGIGYRTNNTFYTTVGGNLYQQFNLGYSLEYALSPISAGSGINHQIILGFTVKNKRRR